MSYHEADKNVSSDFLMKVRMCDLFHNVSRAEIDDNIYKVYQLINIIYKRMYPLFKKDDESLKVLQDVFKELDTYWEGNYNSGFKADNMKDVKSLLNKAEIMLNTKCIVEGLWFTKPRTEKDIYKDVVVVREEDTEDEENS